MFGLKRYEPKEGKELIEIDDLKGTLTKYYEEREQLRRNNEEYKTTISELREKNREIPTLKIIVDEKVREITRLEEKNRHAEADLEYARQNNEKLRNEITQYKIIIEKLESEPTPRVSTQEEKIKRKNKTE